MKNKLIKPKIVKLLEKTSWFIRDENDPSLHPSLGHGDIPGSVSRPDCE
jgi:hypothetical protein